MAGEIANETGNKDDLFRVVTFGLIVDGPRQTAGLDWSRSIVDKWAPEGEYRRRAEVCIVNNLQRRKVAVAGDIVSTDRQMQENILAGLGIDASSQPWASLVDLALKDANPGRVLKKCEHTLVTLDPRLPRSSGWS